MIDNENSTNLSADSLQAPQIQIVWGFLSGPRHRQWDHVLLLISKPQQPVTCIESVQFLTQMLCKKHPNCMYWIQGKHRGSWVWVFLRLSVSLKLIFIVPFNFYSISIFFLIRGGGCHWQGTASGLKIHIGRSKKWHLQGRKVTQGPKCHIGVL